MITAPSPEDILIAREDNAVIAAALLKLPARIERVIRLRYGLAADAHLLREVAQQYGVTTDRIRQIQAKGERILRSLLRQRFGAQYRVREYERRIAAEAAKRRADEERAAQLALKERDKKWFEMARQEWEERVRRGRPYRDARKAYVEEVERHGETPQARILFKEMVAALYNGSIDVGGALNG
jgi:hypothetical protein